MNRLKKKNLGLTTKKKKVVLGPEKPILEPTFHWGDGKI